MYEISSEASFSAAHRLKNYNGPCENVHGHNWRVRAFVRVGSLNNLGIGIDFRTLREQLEKVIAPLDHADLNTVFDRDGINPSSENIAHYIYKKLEQMLPSETCTVSRVEVYETPTNFAAYFEHA